MSQEEFKGYQNTMLEEHKRIGVPNLALEMAERKLQAIHGLSLDDPMDSAIEEFLDVIEALAAAKFSCAQMDRQDLFECADRQLQELRTLIRE